MVGFSYLADNVTFHAFSWTQTDGMQDLGTVGDRYSSAYGINDSGEIVGFLVVPFSYHQVGFVWTNTSGMQPLGAANSEAFGINGRGQVVGFFENTEDALLWTPTEHAENLNRLIPPNFGLMLVQANGINQSGQIAATGTTIGEYNAALLTPTN